MLPGSAVAGKPGLRQPHPQQAPAPGSQAGLDSPSTDSSSDAGSGSESVSHSPIQARRAPSPAGVASRPAQCDCNGLPACPRALTPLNTDQQTAALAHRPRLVRTRAQTFALALAAGPFNTRLPAAVRRQHMPACPRQPRPAYHPLMEAHASLTAAALVEGKRAHGRCCGLLDHVPDSWLHQMIGVLPSSSKAALFGCSKAYAKHVLQSAPGVTLVLDKGKELTAQQAGVRRGIITALLSGRRGFAVHLEPSANQLFPTQLAGQVTRLSITHRVKGGSWSQVPSGYQPMPTCCPWAAMTNLQLLSFGGFKQDTTLVRRFGPVPWGRFRSTVPVSYRNSECKGYWGSPFIHSTDAGALCDAVQAGQLQQLRTLQIHGWQMRGMDDRLACTLGPQLESVEAGWKVLTGQLHHFMALRHLTVRSGMDTDGPGPGTDELPHAFMQELIQHPPLRHLTLHEQLQSEQEYHGQGSCKWHTLTIQFPRIVQLLLLPLADVPEIHIRRGISYYMNRSNHVRDTLAQLAPKIVCQPGPDSEFRMPPCWAMVPLVQRLQGVTTLILQGEPVPGVLPHIWQALPEFVSHICFRDLSYEEPPADWGHLWLGLPQHVTACSFWSCHGSDACWCSLVASAPSHVHHMAFRTWDRDEAQDWLRAGIRAKAPGHVRISIEVESLSGKGGHSRDIESLSDLSD